MTYRGLIPRNEPVFMDDWIKTYGVKTITGELYAEFLRSKAFPEAKRLYRSDEGIWQDDGASIHRKQCALDAVNQHWHTHIPVDVQDAKCDDIFPIGTLWGMLHTYIISLGRDLASLDDLKVEIRNFWRSVSARDCRKLIASFPERCRVILRNGGERLRHEDHRKEE